MRIRKPSPALVVNLIALLVALSGVAVALPGKNTVDSGDVKKNSLKSSDYKNNKMKGADILESSLGQVPSAAAADTANQAANASTVGPGAGIHPIDFNVNGTVPETTVLDLNGLQILASCGPAGTFARSTKAGKLAGHVVDTVFGGFDTFINELDFDPGEVINLTPNFNDGMLIQLSYWPDDASGRNVSAYLASDVVGPFDCAVNGAAESG
jgi:hypothetical protein